MWTSTASHSGSEWLHVSLGAGAAARVQACTGARPAVHCLSGVCSHDVPCRISNGHPFGHQNQSRPEGEQLSALVKNAAPAWPAQSRGSAAAAPPGPCYNTSQYLVTTPKRRPLNRP